MKNFFPQTWLGPVSIALVLAMAGNGIAAPKSNASNPGRSAKTQSAPKSAAAAPASKQLLDTATVRKLYLDGDFEEAIALLDTGLKEKRAFEHKDSVFIFKHLGVMYAAKYDTREKGKYYMHQLLMVEPTAKIMDMYASDMIYMIFKNIQDEFESTRVRLNRAEGHVIGNSQTDPSQKQPEQGPQRTAKEDPKSDSHAIYWIGATGVVVAAGVAAFFLLSEKPATGTNHTVE